MEKDYDYMFKVVLVGMSGVGKSNILLRLTRKIFSEKEETTIGVEYANKLITSQSGKRIKLQIWDTAGQQKYRALMRVFYRGASAAILTYDITQQKTFANLEKEQAQINQFIKDNVLMMIVGNKADLQEKREVHTQRALNYAGRKNLPLYEVSAKDGLNIDLIFTRMAQQLEKTMNLANPEVEIGQKYDQDIIGPNPSLKQSIRLDDERPQYLSSKRKQTKCCSS